VVTITIGRFEDVNSLCPNEDKKVNTRQNVAIYFINSFYKNYVLSLIATSNSIYILMILFAVLKPSLPVIVAMQTPFLGIETSIFISPTK